MDKKSKTNQELKILFLEDSVRDIAIISELLTKAGVDFIINHVDNKFEFEKALSNKKYDVILADFNLPGYDAFEALNRAIEICPEIPVIIVSGFIGEETAIELIKKGAVDYILKDKPDKLPYVLKRALNEAKVKKEQKQAEEALKKSEHNYRMLFDNMSEGIFILDAETQKVVLSNKAIAQIYGFDSEADTLEVNPIDFVLPEDKEAVYKIIAEDMFQNDLQQINEFRSLTKDGREIWISAIGIRTDYKGRLAGLISVRDVTERKQAEEENDRMAKILDIAPNSITIHDFNGNFIYVNQKTFDIHGYTRDEFFALPLGKLDTPETAKIISVRMKEISERGEANFQVEHIRKDGSIFPMEVFAQLTKWGDTNSILSIATDITERKQAEAIKSIQYEIIRIVFSTKNLSEFYETVRGALSQIMNVENFYVAFYDKKTDQLSAVFEKDKKDQIPKWPSGKSLTGRVIKEQKPLILKKAEILNLANTGEIELIGTTAEAWLGVPLIIGGKVSGVLVVQDYDNPQAYNQTHLELLEMVSREMSICIERKQVEEALKESEQKLKELQKNLQDIVEHSPDGIIIADSNGKHRYINNRLCEIIGYDENESLKLTIKDITPADELKKYAEMYKKRIKGEKTPNLYQRTVIAKSGKKIPVEMRTTTTVWEGEKCGLAFITDITERKRVEAEMKKRMNELEIFNEASVDREIIVNELRKEINELLKNNGEKEKYDIIT